MSIFSPLNEYLYTLYTWLESDFMALVSLLREQIIIALRFFHLYLVLQVTGEVCNSIHTKKTILMKAKFDIIDMNIINVIFPFYFFVN